MRYAKRDAQAGGTDFPACFQGHDRELLHWHNVICCEPEPCAEQCLKFRPYNDCKKKNPMI